MSEVSQIVITHIKSAAHGDDTYAGVKKATIDIKTTIKEGQADGAAGTTSQDGTFNDITGTLEFESEAPLIALLNAAMADLVLVSHIGAGSANTTRTTTIKNVVFRGSDLSYPAVNANGLAATTVNFKCTWDKLNDEWRTLAEMISHTDEA